MEKEINEYKRTKRAYKFFKKLLIVSVVMVLVVLFFSVATPISNVNATYVLSILLIGLFSIPYFELRKNL